MTFARNVKITQSAFDRFARLSGDDNPIHVDPRFAATTRFKRTLCHGMYLCSLVDAFVRDVFGRAPVAHELKFPGPAYAGDTLAIQLEQGQVRAGLLELRLRITRGQGEACCEGLVLLQSNGVD